MEMWYPKLKKGGIFAGHDYLNIDWNGDPGHDYPLCENGKDRQIFSHNQEGRYFAGIFGVNPAVDEFCKLHNKKRKVTDEFWGSWYFTKQLKQIIKFTYKNKQKIIWQRNSHSQI